MSRKLAGRQIDVLRAVEVSGPHTARSAASYADCPLSSARSALTALEREGFVATTWAWSGRGGRLPSPAYRITREGADALAAALRESEG